MHAPDDGTDGLAALNRVYGGKWRIWPDRGRWHACRTGSFRQLDDPFELQHSLHADDLGGLALLLAIEQAKEIVGPHELAVFLASSGEVWLDAACR